MRFLEHLVFVIFCPNILLKLAWFTTLRECLSCCLFILGSSVLVILSYLRIPWELTRCPNGGFGLLDSIVVTFRVLACLFLAISYTWGQDIHSGLTSAARHYSNSGTPSYPRNLDYPRSKVPSNADNNESGYYLFLNVYSIFW